MPEHLWTEAVQGVKRLRTRAYRRKTGQVIVEGWPEVSRALKAGVRVDAMYLCPEIFRPESGIPHNVPVTEVPRDVFAAMAFGSRLKGILAVCRPEPLALADMTVPGDATVVVLEAVEKPGNLGAVLRTADGAGVAAVILCDGKTDLYNQHVVRSSIGTVFTVPVTAATSEQTYAFLRERGCVILAASAHAAEEYTAVDMRGPTAIIVGNEHDGVSDFWNRLSDHRVRIPMAGAASSLNVTVSASILIYEARRQKTL
ncbi:MAG: RNA methyltransferase [Candidatus Omnitrophica bacterium]|nr:RNA methyltransferase [Candidatus Omnitrophota bacterium]MCB9720431.1 RNA methyltransferase [Candidatus Omnitrophota bacterium]